MTEAAADNTAGASADTPSNPGVAPTATDMRLVITASSLGTVFEWYDFFLWGTLTTSGILQRSFFPQGNELLATLLAWATFAVGFAFRPLGAVLFGYLGDMLGRKYTFLVTITLMGIATAGIGLVPGYATIGALAPALIILFRILQGLALGGEYGGAAIYVVEHAPPKRAGYLSSYIQASVVGGFILSLVVVLTTKALMPAESFGAWGWRAPFLFSILLLAVSLWMRLKLSESPVFAAMKAAGETAKNPFVESFTYPGNLKRLFVALFGIAGGLTVIWYTAMFSTLSFLKGPMRVEDTTARADRRGGRRWGACSSICWRGMSATGSGASGRSCGVMSRRCCCCSRSSGRSAMRRTRSSTARRGGRRSWWRDRRANMRCSRPSRPTRAG